jgi:hypothetical protein
VRGKLVTLRTGSSLWDGSLFDHCCDDPPTILAKGVGLLRMKEIGLVISFNEGRDYVQVLAPDGYGWIQGRMLNVITENW